MINEINSLTTYEILKLTHFIVPPRSPLHHLEPVGLGTSYTECSTSFTIHLGQAHSVLTRTLVLQEILPLFGRSYLANSEYHSLSTFWNSNCRALNGIGDLAADWVGALQILTLRNDLRFLTMLPWAEVLPSKGLLRLNRAWCPDCFEEWRQNGKIIYEPLMWSLEVVTTCPYHKRRLRQECPKCGANLPHLAPQARLGYCSKCFCWLGQVSKTDELLTDDELKWQGWVTEAVGEMIASTPKLPELPCRVNVAQTISAYVEIISGGNATDFARELQEFNIPISKWSVWDWKSGKQLPQLGTLLKLCYYLGTKPLSFLQGKVNLSNYPQEIPFELVTVPHCN